MKEGGVIVRTAAEGVSEEDIERDLVFLQRLWKTIQATAKSSEGSRRSSTRRRSFRCASRATSSPATSSVALVDNERAYKRIVGYLKKTSPHMAERVVRYASRRR